MSNRVSRSGGSNSLSPSQRAVQSTYLDDMWNQYGLDESYRNDFYNNPFYYKWLKLRNQTGILSGLSEGLFGSSSASRNADQAYSDMLAYWSDMVSEKRQNTYNSEDAKAERMRQAGQNPNLLGTGDVANDVGNPEPAFGSPLEGGMSDMNALGSAFSCVQGILNFGSSLLSLASGFKSLQNLKLQNEGIELDNEIKDVTQFGNIRDFASNLALYSITEDDYKPSKEGLAIDFASATASQYADKYFPESKDPRKTQLRNAFISAFSDARSSIIGKNKTYQDYLSYRKGLVDPAQRDYGYYGQLQDALVQADYWDAKMNAAVAQFNADLYDDKKLTELMKNEKFASLYRSIAESNLATDTANLSDDIVQTLDNEEFKGFASDAVKQQFIAAVKQYVAAQAEAALMTTYYQIRQQYVTDYQQNGFKGQLKYRPLSPAYDLWQESKNGTSTAAGNFGKGVGYAVDGLISILTHTK